MEPDSFDAIKGQSPDKTIQIIESNGKKSLLVKGQLYMLWQTGDETAERLAIAQLYELGLGTQEELAQAFEVHVNSVARYAATFKAQGVNGLRSDLRGPKQSWKIIPDVRAKILMTVLKEGIVGYTEIQKHLKQRWNRDISVASIRQVLLENGFVEERIRGLVEQGDLFDPGKINLSDPNGMELFEAFGGMDKVAAQPSQDATREKLWDGASAAQFIGTAQEERLRGVDGERTNTSRERCSQAGRIYLDQLERGMFSAYAGGLLFAPLIEQYHFLEIIKKVVNIPTHEGYSLEQLCLTFFYFDVFEFRSIEDFKTAYPEEYGPLIGRSVSPGIRTLRRFLHQVRALKKGEDLMEEFAREYLRSGLCRWGVLYIDSHFLPYYGMLVITMGWCGVRDKALKGSYQFLAIDEQFNPFLFLIRPSSEDLIEKISELIDKAKKIGRDLGINTEDLTVVFDREGYSAELFRKLDEMQPKVKFVTWAKYMDRWLEDYKDRPFDKSATVRYALQDDEEIKYFETERVMNKYGPIRTLVIESARKNQRSAIFTNSQDDGGRIIELMCRRWGQETLNKTHKWDHKMDYHPGYVEEELEEQPLVKNPRLKELKRQKANIVSKLNGLKLKFVQQAFEETKKDPSWKELKEKNKEIYTEIVSLQAQITLADVEIAKFSKEVPFDQAHDGRQLVQLDYEKKRFLDSIKVFTYRMEKGMCSVLSEYYDDPDDIYVVLSMIVRRGGDIKLEGDRLTVRLKGFKNLEVDFAARRLCQELNQMRPRTLDKYRFPICYEVA